MLSIIAAIIGGVLFWWLQQTFKKFEHETTPALVIKFACGLCALAVLAFLIPFFLAK
jgi:H+/Cl- antiporter ClcA